MKDEVESKFPISLEDVQKLKSRLKSLHSPPLQDRLEENFYFDTKSFRLNRKGQVVRVRHIINQDKTVEYVITFKGKQKKSKFKRRKEIELSVNSFSDAYSLLIELGFKFWFSYQKKRTSYMVDQCIVDIDELPKIGFYCEIEGKSEKDVDDVKSKLGFSDVKSVGGYGSLFEIKRNKITRMRFK